MQHILQTVSELLHQGRDAVMVSIVACNGTVPGGTGAHILVLPEGTIAGSLGGGALQRRAVQLAQQALKARQSHAETVNLLHGEAAALANVCDGTAQLLVQYLPAGTQNAGFFARAAQSCSVDDHAWLLWDITQPAQWQMARVTQEGCAEVLHSSTARSMLATLPAETLQELLVGGPVLQQGSIGTIYAEPLAQAGRVVLFGANATATQLVPALDRLAFHCVVYDDRPDYANPARFPRAWRVLRGDYFNIDANLALMPTDYIVIATGSPDTDYEVAHQVLASGSGPFAYVGLLGNPSQAGLLARRLSHAGIHQQAIDSLQKPPSLAGGGKDPTETAVAIAAQLIETRHRQQAEKLWQQQLNTA